jgi:translation elongation factor EF-1beta
MTVMKIYPEEKADTAKLLEAIYKVKGCASARVEEFAYGIKIIRAGFVCEDSEGTDFEEMVKKVPGVSEVQVDDVTLIS